MFYLCNPQTDLAKPYSQIFFFARFGGLMPLFFIYFYFIQHSYNHSRTYAQWAEPPWGADLRLELGPALQQAGALPSEPGRTLKSRRTPSQSELRRTQILTKYLQS